MTINTKEIALVSVFSSIWIVSQIYLGPIIGQITKQHGVVQRVVGWLLMLILAELTGKFGRVSIMATVAALVTRLIRPGPLYALFVGAGYALGGITFDLLFFMPLAHNFSGKTRYAYLLTIAVLSGVVAFIPYLLYKLYFLGIYAFIVWIPVYAYGMVRGVLLSVLGTLAGLSITPQIKKSSLNWRARLGGAG